jgi:hypothetical protein
VISDWQPKVKKTHDRFASRGFLSKLKLRSTSPVGGVAYDDDQQDDLPILY